MTHYQLTQLATRKCEHGNNTVCCCERKQPTPAVQEYLDKAKRRYPKSIIYNPPYDPNADATYTYAYHSKRYRWVEYPDTGLRFVGKVHDICRNHDDVPRRLVEHTGWFTDSVFRDETVCGEVYQLPSRHGKHIYIPAVSDPNTDVACLDFTSTTDDLSDAVRQADRMAEIRAEHEREYRAKDQAEQRISEIKEEIQTAYKNFRELARETRANCDKLTGMDKVKQLIRDEWQRVKRNIRELRREQRKLEDDFWSITH